MMDASLDAALPFIAWARIFSPLASTEVREEAWRALTLPDRFADCESEFNSAFVVGLPAPRVPLLLHATLGRDGTAVREDWMRVIAHLQLRWNEKSLPPDHLGVACDVLAAAIAQQEDFLVGELFERYLEPWCAAAVEVLGGGSGGVALLPSRFAEDLSNAVRDGRSAPRFRAPSPQAARNDEPTSGAGGISSEVSPGTEAQLN